MRWASFSVSFLVGQLEGGVVDVFTSTLPPALCEMVHPSYVVCVLSLCRRTLPTETGLGSFPVSVSYPPLRSWERTRRRGVSR